MPVARFCWHQPANKIPSLIQEQNSYAGLTNKQLGGKVQRICVAYPGMDKYFP
jgi:UDP-N-acetylglucosamine--N-acetylmuramyl-(pentapeptide) pyrophosphoryl-undecaprenol N-acetylglucosamine transferase